MTPELILWPSHDKEKIPSSESLERPGGHCAKCNKPGTDSQKDVLVYTWNIKQTYKNKKCRHVCKGLETDNQEQKAQKSI